MQYNSQTNSILKDKTRKKINVKKSKKNTCQCYENISHDQLYIYIFLPT